MSDMIPSNPKGSGPSRKVKPGAPKKKHSGEHQQRRTEKTSKSRQAIASDEDCLHALSRMPGLVAMGVLTTAQANSIRGVYSTILGYHQKAKGTRTDHTLDSDSLMDLLRQNPQLISMLEPLLTDEQIKMLMNDATDGEDEQT